MPAYSFGLRHAVDTDHIASIDNVTRKLIFQAVKRGEPFVDDDLDILLNGRGFLSCIFRPLLLLRNGNSFSTIMVFPALFTASMSLVDTTDGVMMLGAYGWAFRNPLRKLYCNLTITAVPRSSPSRSAASKPLVSSATSSV